MRHREDEDKYEDQADSILQTGDRVRRVAMLVMLVAMLLCTSSASACDRCGLFGNRCVLRKAVVVQQVVAAPIVYPQVNYFVGAPIRVEAIVQQALQQDPEFAEFQRFKIWKQGTQPLAENPAAPTVMATSVIAQKCAKCHSGAAPKKGVVLDGVTPLSCELALQAMRAVKDGEMPPEHKLTPEEAGDVIQELIDLVKVK